MTIRPPPTNASALAAITSRDELPRSARLEAMSVSDINSGYQLGTERQLDGYRIELIDRSG
jgi:hypothetical protein